MAQQQVDKPTVKEEPQKTEGEGSPSSSTKEPLTTEKEVAPDKQAFIQMRREISDLKRQVAEREQFAPRVSDYTPPVQQQVDRSQFYDQVTGEFDFNSYDQAVQQRIESARVSQEQTARQIAKEEADMAAVKVAYPTLNSGSENYDPEFEEDVASRYYFARYVQGKNVSVLDIARDLSQRIKKETKSQEAKTEAQVKQSISNKEIATSETGAKSAGVANLQKQIENIEEEDVLAWKTRGQMPQVVGYDNRGMPIRPKVSDDETTAALMQRLKDRPWKKPIA